jgi:hypothetical protein
MKEERQLQKKEPEHVPALNKLIRKALSGGY